MGKTLATMKQIISERWSAVVLLLLFWGRLLHTATQQSVTFDEILHILQGVLFWRQWQLFSVVQNPPLINAWIGLAVNGLFHPSLPLTQPAWGSNDWLTLSQLFMWQENPNGLQLIWAGRWAIMLLALLLGALLFRWGRQLFAVPHAGLLPLLLFTFDPNILAHSFLATTDLGTAAFFTLAAFMVWYYWSHRPNSKHVYLLVGVALGLALAAKFSGIILLIGLLCLILYRLVTEPSHWRTAVTRLSEFGGWLVITTAVFLSTYRWQFPPLLADFRIQQAHQLEGHSAYFMGEISKVGWWYYFPTVFAIKTPLPTLILLLLALGLFVWLKQWQRWSLVWPLLLAGGVLAAGMVSHVDIGFRYLLPMLPLLFLFTGELTTAVSPRWLTLTTAVCCLFLLPISLTIHPNYLAYFNQLAGGPDNGWRWVVDSNIDWGQDLVALAGYAHQHPEPIQAAWLGSAPLSAYGINHATPMPIWPHGKENPTYDPFYPPQPAPGTYVISVTQLQGAYLKDPTRFRWFQTRQPDEKLGYSLFVYRLPASGTAVGLGLSGVAASEIGLDDMAELGSNDVAVRWFDARTSFLWPGGTAANVWTIVGDAHQPQSLLQPLYPATPTHIGDNGNSEQHRRYLLYQWHQSPVATLLTQPNVSSDFGWSPQPLLGADGWATERKPLKTAVFNQSLQLLGYQMPAYQPGQPLQLLTLWRVKRPLAEPVKLFVHLLDGAGNLVAQHDGLDVYDAGLQPGDEFAQLHTLALPSDLIPGRYALQLGVYVPTTGQRLPLENSSSDRVLLHAWSVAP